MKLDLAVEGVQGPPMIHRLALCVLLGAQLAGCGQQVTDTIALPAGVTLPVAEHGVVSQADDGTVHLDVMADGEIRVEGEGPLTLVATRTALNVATAAPEWREPDRSSRRTLRLRVDASVPWVLVQWVMMVAAEPSVLMWKIDVAVQDATGADRVLPIRLPKDRGINSPQRFVEELPILRAKVFRRHVTVGDGSSWTRIRVGNQDTIELHAGPRRAAALSALRDALVKGWETMGRNPDARAEIAAPPPHGPAVPHGDVMAVYDAYRAVGFEVIRFDGAPLPTGLVDDVQALKDHVAKLRP